MSASPAHLSRTSLSLESEQSPVLRVHYRPDVDGLRAVAALAVLGIHVGVLPGGFIGVDIFFVISGFLITGIILRALTRGSFSSFDFYARRVKRIFPALLVVLIAVIGFGWLTLLAGEYRQLGREIAEGAGFVRDLSQYWHHDDDLHIEVSGTKMSHLWSLGVEEQFYLLWPLLLILAFKLGRWRIALIAGLMAISFVTNIALASQGHHAAYFLPVPRLWELSLGGALAYIELQRQVAPRQTHPITCAGRTDRLGRLGNHALSVLGAVLILWSLFNLNSTDQFPGWQALAPCVGTLLLIAAGPRSWVNLHILSSPPIVFIGLISYPLYLWHYPVLQIPHVLWGEETLVTTAAAALSTLVLAFFTYRYVELPIRSSQNTTLAAGALCAAMLVCIVVGSMMYFGVIPARSQPPGVAGFLAATTQDWLPGTHDTTWTQDADGLLTLGKGPRQVLYLGDSNMGQYYPRIEKLLAENPGNYRSAIFAVRSWCTPGVFEIAPVSEDARAACTKFLRNAFARAAAPTVDSVVIGGCWSCYFLDKADLFSGTTSHLNPDTDKALESLRQSIAGLKARGKRVYVVLGNPMDLDFDPRQMIRRTILTPGFRLDVRTPSRSHALGAIAPIASRVRHIAQASGATIIDPVPVLCDPTSCPSISGKGQPIYHDWWNLSPAYVRDNLRILDDTLLTAFR